MKLYNVYNSQNAAIMKVEAIDLEQACQRVQSIFGQSALGQRISRITEAFQW